ncbi:MAG: cation-translocating P-type ATPase, partial [Clostridiales bacterium]|nr:cation-translocating P-type ATPase [Candidatus Equinaster intestinalis]
MRSKFSVTGMSCAACSARVEKVVSRIDGVTAAQVNLIAGTLLVESADELLPETVISAVEKAGFKADIYRENAVKSKKEDYKSFKIRLIVSFAFLLPLMYISMSHMVSLPLPHIFQDMRINAVVQLLLTLPIIAVNRSYFLRGFKHLFSGGANMDTLIALGASASVIYGIFETVRIFGGQDTGVLYYESAAMILSLITLGKFFETRSKNKAGDAIEKMRRLSPDTVTVKKDGKEFIIETSLLLKGDTVCVKAGERLAADGTVISGFGSVDESAVTGESIPSDKAAGDTVIGGTVLRDGYIEFTVNKVGGDTLLGEIIKMTEDTAASKVPLARLADKVSGVF